MKQKLLLLAACFGTSLVWHSGAAQTLDPTFAAVSAYSPGNMNAALEQPDGKRVVTGNYTRLNGAPAYAMTRFNTNGTVDAAFQQNIGVATGAYRVRLLANGKFLLGYSIGAPFTIGGITRQTMAQLNADGTGDPSFDIGAGPTYGTSISYVDDYLPLANGQIMAVGGWDHFNGTVVPSGIIRLSATGAIDPTFAPGAGADTYDDIESIVALPSGKFLVGGYLTMYNGTVRSGIAGLNADGTLDASFNAGMDPYSEVSNIVVQPDGRILVSGNLDYTTSRGYGRGITRLLADGTLDPSFTPPTGLQNGGVANSYSGDAMQLQPDGKILVISSVAVGSPVASRMVRLNADGTVDPAFQVGAGPNLIPRSIKLLSNGNVLVTGNFTNFNGTLDRQLIELTSTGALVTAAPPVFQSAGAVSAVVQQADGKLVAGGNFSEINGQAVRRLARFNTNGSIDGTFAANVGIEGTVSDLALQPDGRILAAGQNLLRRFSTAGVLDNTFNASIGSSTSRILLQPDGRVLVGSSFLILNGTQIASGIIRLLATGARDNTFAPATTGSGRFTSFNGFGLQPDGKIVLAGNFIPTGATVAARSVMRLDATGAVDQSFTGGRLVGGNSGLLSSFDFQPDGKIIVGGSFGTYGGVARTSVARLNADGTLDTGFTPPTLAGNVNKVKLQPNGRVLLGGNFSGTGVPNNLARLLATGAADASYAATAVPNLSVTSVLVQPDGKIVTGGSFTTISGQAAQALVRLTATNVLHVAAPAAVAARTEAWPVPAHFTLTVAPDASAHPQAVELLDLLGRPVLRQNLSGSTPAVLAVESLRAGTYLLRVSYAEGQVTRRVQVQ